MNHPQSDHFVAEVIDAALVNSETTDPSAEEIGLRPMVMVVEDDQAIATSLRIRLGIQGYRFCVASDAVNALTVALEHEPACLILDVNLPGGDGFGLAERLRRELGNPNIPVVFLTASMRPGLREKAESLGHSRFMSKPYDSAKLLLLVKDLVDSADGEPA